MLRDFWEFHLGERGNTPTKKKDECYPESTDKCVLLFFFQASRFGKEKPFVLGECLVSSWLPFKTKEKLRHPCVQPASITLDKTKLHGTTSRIKRPLSCSPTAIPKKARKHPQTNCLGAIPRFHPSP